VDGNHDFLLAGGLTFSIFICIIPFVLIIFAISSMMLENPSVGRAVDSMILQVIPYENQADYAKQFVVRIADELKGGKHVAGVIGILGLLFASSRLFSSMRTILNLVFRISLNGSILRGLAGKLKDFGMVILVLLYFLASTTILPALEIFEQFAEKTSYLQGLGFGFLADFLLSSISFIIIFIAFFIMYYLVPQAKLPFKAVILSSFSAAVLWKLAQYFFGLYITNVVSLKQVYGAYMLVIVIAFWIYYTSMVFIVGAEIGQLYREKKRAAVLSAPAKT
jgi:membrane protein